MRECLGLKLMDRKDDAQLAHQHTCLIPSWSFRLDRQDCTLSSTYVNTINNTSIVTKPKKLTPIPNRHIGLYILIVLSGDVSVNPGPNSSPASLCVACKKLIRINAKPMKCSDCGRAVHSKCSKFTPSERIQYFIAKRDWYCNSCAAPCGSCPNLVRNQDPAVQCDTCEKWYHIACGNFDNDLYKSYRDNDQSFDWSCPTCDKIKPKRQNRRANGTSSRRNVNKKSQLKMLVINFQCIKNKIAQLAALVKEHQPDIIQGTETWLSSAISLSEIFPTGYTIFRKDRHQKEGGGIILAIKENLVCTEIAIESNKEIMWHKLELSGRQSLIIGTIYKPSHKDFESVVALQASLDEINRKHPSSDILIAGDLNQPNIDWQTVTVIPNHQYCKKTAEKLLEVTIENGPEQFVHEPTRGQSILDLIFTNNPFSSE